MQHVLKDTRDDRASHGAPFVLRPTFAMKVGALVTRHFPAAKGHIVKHNLVGYTSERDRLGKPGKGNPGRHKRAEGRSIAFVASGGRDTQHKRCKQIAGAIVTIINADRAALVDGRMVEREPRVEASRHVHEGRVTVQKEQTAGLGIRIAQTTARGVEEYTELEFRQIASALLLKLMPELVPLVPSLLVPPL